MSSFHQPVLVTEVKELLLTNPSGIYVDCTIGGGGHSKAILQEQNFNGVIIGIDKDSEAINFSKKSLSKWSDQVSLFEGNFKNINYFLQEEGISSEVDGVLYDLGVSFHQISTPDRGFSYSQEGPLDMRMDRSSDLTASEVVNSYSQSRLGKLFSEYGEEKRAFSIASEVVKQRKNKELATTKDLTDCIDRVTPARHRKKTYARIFQAIRIEVNEELHNLKVSLNKTINTLVPGGRICVIAYHSLEDRIIKSKFRTESKECVCPPSFPVCDCDHEKKINILTKSPITPSQEEINSNPKSRSAKLRACERI